MVSALTPTSVARVQIIVQIAYPGRNQVDKEPFRGRATSIASSFKRCRRNVSVNPNVLSTFIRKMLR